MTRDPRGQTANQENRSLSPDFDAIVIGAGPAGSTAALLLARAGWSVAIVEKSEFPRRKVCGEFISAPALTLLTRLGIAEGVIASAGPEVRRVAVYAGERVVEGDMPSVQGAVPYGRAIGRDRLDTLLLEAAKNAGAVVWQPWRVSSIERRADGYVCRIDSKSSNTIELAAPVVIAAHGSWDTGRLPLRGAAAHAAASDLLAFKAHFTGGALASGCMPLVAFPGGYGGLVHSSGGQISFSCCIRRDVLSTCRAAAPGSSAGAAVLAHALGSCRGMREALDGAVREGSWLAAGPLRPGIRSACSDGYFAIGNALGEAHPIVAEGISMAIQSAWLLCERLIAEPRARGNVSWNRIAGQFEAAYRANFAPRIWAASSFAMLAMRPTGAAVAVRMLEAVPGLLAYGARFAGKARPLRASA